MINRVISIALIVALVWFPAMSDAASANPPAKDPAVVHPHQNSITPAGNANIFRVTHDGREYEVLRGREAHNHIKNLRARHAKAFEIAEKDMLRRGFKPTEHAVVIRSVSNGVQPVQSVQSDEGEIAFSSWDDGQNQTWEGTMYASTYDDGSYTIFNGQVDTEYHEVMWEYNVYVYDGPLTDVNNQAREKRERRQTPYLLTSFTNGGKRPFHLVQRAGTTQPKIRDWVGCVVGCCIVAAGSCVFSGPLYPECLVLGCAACKVGCTADWIISNWPRR